MLSIRHPNCAAIYGVCTEPPAIVMGAGRRCAYNSAGGLSAHAPLPRPQLRPGLLPRPPTMLPPACRILCARLAV